MFFVSTSNTTKLSEKQNSYSFDNQRCSYFILGYTTGGPEDNIRNTMAARGLVNGRSRATSKRSCGPLQRAAKWEGFSFPYDILRNFSPQKKQKLTFWVSLKFYSEIKLIRVLHEEPLPVPRNLACRGGRTCSSCMPQHLAGRMGSRRACSR